MTNRTQQTVRELLPALGEQVAVRFEDMIFDCTVLDAKNAWGKVRILVQPIKGTGHQWIELGRLTRYAANVTPTHAKVPYGRCTVCGHYGSDCTGSVATPESMQQAQEAARENARYAAQLNREDRRLHPEDYTNEGSY